MEYLISDLHLHKNQPHVPGLFFYFMAHIAPKADNLYVLGDLFEYWVGDDFRKPPINKFSSTVIFG